MKKCLNKILCYLFWHKINTYLIEHSKYKICKRCGVELYIPFIETTKI